MRIGVDVRALMEGRTTGVQVYILNLLHALFKIDQKNEYILFANSYKKFSLPEFDYPNVSYKVTRYPNKLFNFSQKYLGFPKVDKLLDGLDLFFSPHWRVVALSPNLPLVITFHDLSYEIFPEFFTLKQRLWHSLMNYRGASVRADKIIAVSNSTKEDIEKLYRVDQAKISVIYSGSLLGNKKSSLNLPEKYFLSFATFEPRKNISNLIQAYESYYDKSKEKITLVIAGSRGWKSELDVPEKLKDSVIFFKNVDEPTKKSLYSRAYAFLFLSFYEGFGFPVLEAASLGVPVISSLSTSLAEVGKDFAIFVNPFRPEQVARSMLALETDPVLYKDSSERAKKVSEKFSWDTCASETLQLFISACE